MTAKLFECIYMSKRDLNEMLLIDTKEMTNQNNR